MAGAGGLPVPTQICEGGRGLLFVELLVDAITGVWRQMALLHHRKTTHIALWELWGNPTEHDSSVECLGGGRQRRRCQSSQVVVRPCQQPSVDVLGRCVAGWVGRTAMWQFDVALLTLTPPPILPFNSDVTLLSGSHTKILFSSAVCWSAPCLWRKSS